MSFSFVAPRTPSPLCLGYLVLNYVCRGLRLCLKCTGLLFGFDCSMCGCGWLWLFLLFFVFLRGFYPREIQATLALQANSSCAFLKAKGYSYEGERAGLVFWTNAIPRRAALVAG